MLVAGFRVDQRDRVQARKPLDDQPAFVHPLARPAAAVVSQRSPRSVGQAGKEDRPQGAFPPGIRMPYASCVPGRRNRRVPL